MSCACSARSSRFRSKAAQARPREARRLLDRAEGLRDGAATIEPTLLRELGAMPPEHATDVPPQQKAKGNFVVKTEKKTVVSLIGLARPFPKLKALDMDKVCADVVAAL